MSFKAAEIVEIGEWRSFSLLTENILKDRETLRLGPEECEDIKAMAEGDLGPIWLSIFRGKKKVSIVEIVNKNKGFRGEIHLLGGSG